LSNVFAELTAVNRWMDAASHVIVITVIAIVSDVG